MSLMRAIQDWGDLSAKSPSPSTEQNNMLKFEKKIVLKSAQIYTLRNKKAVYNFVFKFHAVHHTEVKIKLLMSTCIGTLLDT